MGVDDVVTAGVVKHLRRADAVFGEQKNEQHWHTIEYIDVRLTNNPMPELTMEQADAL